MSSDAKIIRRDIETGCTECVAIIANLRYWVSGIGAVFILSLGTLIGKSDVVHSFPPSGKILIFVGVIALAANIVVLAIAVLLQEVSHHGLKYIAFDKGQLNDDEVLRYHQKSVRAGSAATIFVYVSAFLSVTFLAICVLGTSGVLWG